MNRVVLSDCNHHKSLDEFDYNIIDISNEAVWRYAGRDFIIIDSKKDLLSIMTMVEHSEKACNIYVLPKNIDVKWEFFSSKYKNSDRLKNKLTTITKILNESIPHNGNLPIIIFENTTTIINE